MWFNNMKPWWLAFVLTWLVTVVALSVSGGVDVTTAGRWGLVSGAIAGIVVWAVLRATNRTQG